MAGVHQSTRLEDQAAAAALNSHREQHKSAVLDEDGKLSSAMAAVPMKSARAQDLPSFPSAGGKMSSAGAAASLADSNKKSFEHWKPGSIPAANRAAILAKDYEPDPLWQPEMSAAGSKAALLAHRDTPSVEIWKSQGTEAGHSAAGQALKSKSPNAITARDVTPDDRRKALLAAGSAMAGNRPRSGSVPVSRGENKSWALQAANSSQKNVPNAGPFASGDPGFEAARVQNMAKNNVNRQLYGSNPPVAPEIEEKNRQDTLKASAVAMAKTMYAIQQKHIDEASGIRRSDSKAAATSSHQRNLSDSSTGASGDNASVQTPRYENLEEAARKLARERLEKMRDEHAEYRQYYGTNTAPARSRFSVSLRRRASTGEKDDDSSDEDQPRRIRRQMSMMKNKVAEIDKKRQQADRDAVLEAAHRNVEARLAKMDKEVFQQTGKPSPAQKEMWEQEARERAQKSVDESMKNVGKVHIGGGQYMDQSQVDAIAKARLQPTLDEITETAEKQRALDAEMRAEHERVEEQVAKQKARDAEVKAEIRATQDQEKAEARKKKAEEKQASKEKAMAEKEEARAAAAEEKEKTRKEKEEKKAQVAEEKEKERKEKEEKKAQAAEEKEKERKETEERKAALAEEKEKEKEKSRIEREQKQAEAAAEKERERFENEEKRKSVEVKPGRLNSILRRKPKDSEPTETEFVSTERSDSATASEPAAASTTQADTVHDNVTLPTAEAPDIERSPSAQKEDTIPGTLTADEEPMAPSSKRESKVKSWFKTRLRGGSKTSKENVGTESTTTASEEAEKARDESIRDVAMAGRETQDMYGTEGGTNPYARPVSPIEENDAGKISKASSISSYSTREFTSGQRPLSGTEQTAQVGRPGLKAKLMKKIKPGKDESGEPMRKYSVSDDGEFEEAKDKQDEEDKLPLPPTISSAGNGSSSPKTSHEQSKFREEL